MPKPSQGERIAIWTHRATFFDKDDCEYGYTIVDELYIMPQGVKERRGLKYHPRGAPNTPAIVDDHTRDVQAIELEGLIAKYGLSDEDAQRVIEAVPNSWIHVSQTAPPLTPTS